MELKVFGIRHHGPGSARSLRKALSAFDPDCLLIEGPADADKLIPYIAEKELKPPVAILIYDPKDFDWAGYFPFARFSPEWQAIKYGLKKEIETRFIDWPMGLAWEMESAEKQGKLFGEPGQGESLPKRKKWQNDPLRYMAQLAGYDDSERWWDVTFEQAANDLEVFDVISEMMQALRSELGHGDDSNLWREAYMRREIRKAVKAGKERIAVVCGAWHVPGLEGWEGIPASVDNKVFRGIRKRKTAGSWIPWTYERLAVSSGYGAGVVSPAWYRLLFDSRKEVSMRFLTRAARLLRQEKLDASSAQVIDAVHLAEGLASMRQLQIPGIGELREAALSTFCEGSLNRLQLIDERLVIGDRVGKVPGNIPQVPLMRDLEKAIKSARLRKEYESSESHRKVFDLRVKSNKDASTLLHRLQALDIPWGKLQESPEGALGSFQEKWRLKWRANFSLKVIEASVYGRSLEEAANNFVLKKAGETTSLTELSRMTGLCLLGELQLALPGVIKHLNRLAAQSGEINAMMEALPELVRIFRYGDVRQTPPEDVRILVHQWIPRIAIGLGAGCSGLNADEARAHFKRMQGVNQSVHLLEEGELEKQWMEALHKLAGLKTAAPMLQGAAARICFDQGMEGITQASMRMRYALSSIHEAEKASLWLEGFLHGSGLLLVYQPSLWEILDEWVDQLSPDHFKAILPLVRRAFSDFSDTEREALWKLANGEKSKLTDRYYALNESLQAVILPTLSMLLAKKSREAEIDGQN